MPAYPWLARTALDAESMAAKMRALRALGVPYTDAEIEASARSVSGMTEMDAMVAYLQGLGTALKDRR
jgi:cytochrome c oxidase cbb3-type subunit 2